jgi:hypothetical protein
VRPVFGWVITVSPKQRVELHVFREFKVLLQRISKLVDPSWHYL